MRLRYFWLLLLAPLVQAQVHFSSATVCSSSSSALTWASNTGFACNAAINAATLGGATFAAPAAIGSGTPAAGNFTTLGATGLLTASLGATISGAATSINASSNFNTTIGTGTSTGTTTIGNTAGTGSGLTVNAPITYSLGTALSAATWSTAGIGLVGSAATFNDTTTGSGGVANDAIYAFGIPTLTNTQGTANVLTNLYGYYFPGPVCGSGWASCTNLWGVYTTGQIGGTKGANISGAAISFNTSSNFQINLGTGTSTATIGIGNGSGNNTIGIGNGTGVVTFASPVTMSNATVKLSGVTTGTNVDTVCLGSAGLVLIQAAACTISSLRFKKDVSTVRAPTMPKIAQLRVASFRMKDGERNRDPNGAGAQVGLIAENIASIAPECAIYEQDMKTPKSFRQECVLALMVKAMQEQQGEIKELKRQLRVR